MRGGKGQGILRQSMSETGIWVRVLGGGDGRHRRKDQPGEDAEWLSMARQDGGR